MSEGSGDVVPVGVGEVLVLRETDYRYGTGELRLRVTAAPTQSPDPHWMTVSGVELRWNDQPGVEREVSVPVEVLRHPRVRSVR
ncbi:hypothetical protein ACQP00_20735 [Dactylosporangium sp. CS-047395]|uniref:hypothetical protein n=1 Tax=Dactylosporangium sp. CS-047395 TaxID=3239936 RepID=UPI003D8B2F3D